jgi:hypothetical protein
MPITDCSPKPSSRHQSIVCASSMGHQNRTDGIEPYDSFETQESRGAPRYSKTSNATQHLHPSLQDVVQTQCRRSRLLDELYRRSQSLPGTKHEVRCASHLCYTEPTHQHRNTPSTRVKKQMAAGAQRQRWCSPSIAIPKGKPNLQAEADRADRTKAVRESNISTWQLYERIMTHRQKRNQVTPLLLDCHGEGAEDDDSHRVSCIGTKESHLQQRHQSIQRAMDTSWTSTTMADEEIFVMDL